MKKLNILITIFVSPPFVAPGCRQPAQDTGTAWTVVAEGDMIPKETVQHEKALAARDAMHTSDGS